MARASGTGWAAILLVLTTAGCSALGTTHGQAASRWTYPASIEPSWAQQASIAAGSMTGTRLSALMTAPVGFTVVESSSYDSGDVSISNPPGTNPQTLSCATWWAGRSYYGPGNTGYAVKEFIGSDRTTVTVIVDIYRRGGGTEVFDATKALHDRCTHFTYQDASDHLFYQVDVQPASSAGLGDQRSSRSATRTSASPRPARRGRSRPAYCPR